MQEQENMNVVGNIGGLQPKTEFTVEMAKAVTEKIRWEPGEAEKLAVEFWKKLTGLQKNIGFSKSQLAQTCIREEEAIGMPYSFKKETGEETGEGQRVLENTGNAYSPGVGHPIDTPTSPEYAHVAELRRKLMNFSERARALGMAKISADILAQIQALGKEHALVSQEFVAACAELDVYIPEEGLLDLLERSFQEGKERALDFLKTIRQQRKDLVALHAQLQEHVYVLIDNTRENEPNPVTFLDFQKELKTENKKLDEMHILLNTLTMELSRIDYYAVPPLIDRDSGRYYSAAFGRIAETFLLAYADIVLCGRYSDDVTDQGKGVAPTVLVSELAKQLLQSGTVRLVEVHEGIIEMVTALEELKAIQQEERDMIATEAKFAKRRKELESARFSNSQRL